MVRRSIRWRQSIFGKCVKAGHSKNIPVRLWTLRRNSRAEYQVSVAFLCLSSYLPLSGHVTIIQGHWQLEHTTSFMFSTKFGPGTVRLLGGEAPKGVAGRFSSSSCPIILPLI